MPLHGFWVAMVRTTTATGRLGGAGSLDVSTANQATYPISGPLYDPSGAEYAFPGQGPAWVLAGLSAYQPVTISLGGKDFNGTVVRSGVWRDQVSLFVQGGLTQVGGYPGAGLNRVTTTIYEVLVDVARAANATLSPLIDTSKSKYSSLLSTINFQPTATLRLSDTLDQLVTALNTQAGPSWSARQAALYQNPSLWPLSITPIPDLYHWRFLLDGTLWMGLDFYPSESDSGTDVQDPPVEELSTQNPGPSVITWLDNRPQQGLETFGFVNAILFPGDTYVSPQTPYGLAWPLTAAVSLACAVEYHWDGTRMVMSVLNGAANSPVSSLAATNQGGSTTSGGW